eukprot:9843836-Karenia_brevis.AAC.1
MSPMQDRDPKRTKKNAQAEMPTGGMFGPADKGIAPNKLSFDQVPMTPGKPGPSNEKPEGMKEQSAKTEEELKGKSAEEKKQMIEETLSLIHISEPTRH